MDAKVIEKLMRGLLANLYRLLGQSVIKGAGDWRQPGASSLAAVAGNFGADTYRSS